MRGGARSKADPVRCVEVRRARRPGPCVKVMQSMATPGGALRYAEQGDPGRASRYAEQGGAGRCVKVRRATRSRAVRQCAESEAPGRHTARAMPPAMLPMRRAGRRVRSVGFWGELSHSRTSPCGGERSGRASALLAGPRSRRERRSAPPTSHDILILILGIGRGQSSSPGSHPSSPSPLLPDSRRPVRPPASPSRARPRPPAPA